ncbi:hypothetical protein K4K51_005651 [Colletotrichum sp. SAR 10_75]|nr:hypothetical protein K4K51_005651 [Colletotrichum sp. SAR 10_75]
MPKGRNYRLASEREDDRINLPARLQSTAHRRFNEAGEEINPQGSQEVFATQTQQPDNNVSDKSDVDDVAFGMDFSAGGDDNNLSNTSIANQGRTQDPDNKSSDGDNSNVKAAVNIDASDSEIEDAVKQGRHLPGVTMDDITAAQDYEDARPMEEVAAFSEDLTGDKPLIVPPVTIKPLPTDPSVIQPHHQNQFIEMSDFEFAFGCLLHQYDINRPQYAGIVKVISLLRAPGGKDKPLKEVSALPNQLATIKSQVSRRMPLIDMRKAEVPLNVEKLRTETATRKAEAAAAAARGEDPKPPTANLHIINPVNLFKAVLSSDIAENQMHTRLACSNFNDTIQALQSLSQLDKEVVMNINSVDTIVCVPTLCYISDMPQQDKNSGFRGPKANKFCRFYFISQTAVKSRKASNILDFNVVTHSQYHYQTIEMQKEIESKGTKTATKAFASQWGLSKGQLAPTLAQLSPALNLIMSHPPDPAHSEYQGISELMHNTLLDKVLSKSGRLAYNEKLRY